MGKLELLSFSVIMMIALREAVFISEVESALLLHHILKTLAYILSRFRNIFEYLFFDAFFAS